MPPEPAPAAAAAPAASAPAVPAAAPVTQAAAAPGTVPPAEGVQAPGQQAPAVAGAPGADSGQQPDATKPADGAKPAEAIKPVRDILDEDEETGGEKAPGEEGEKKPDGDAVEYAEFTLPENFKADEAVMGEFKALAGEMKLPQGEAQRLVDLYSREVARMAAEPLRAWNDVKTAWQTEIKAMPEFQGAAFRDATRSIKSAFDAMDGGPELKQALEMTGAINHPKVFRFFSQWAGANSEKPLARGSHPPAAGARTPGERVYGNS